MSAPELRYSITCKFCPKTFSVSPLDVAPMPEPVGKRVLNLINELTKHIAKKHPEHFRALQAAVQDFYGMTLLTLFSHEDPTLIARIEQVRETLKACISATKPSTDAVPG